MPRLTHDEINALTPDELCREVAVRVMGWRLVRDGADWEDEKGKHPYFPFQWRPDRDPRCWMEVLKRLVSNGHQVQLDLDRRRYLMSICHIWSPPTLHQTAEMDAEPGIAVCRASLMAVATAAAGRPDPARPGRRPR